MTLTSGSRAAVVLSMLLLAACGDDPSQALGTLEYHRIALPAPAAERIVAIEVREGEKVEAGQPLLRLEDEGAESATRALRADAQRQRSALQELEAGPRDEAIAQTRAQLAAVQAQAREAQAYYARLQPLGRRQLVAAADVDRARAAAGDASARVRVALAAVAELEHGTRPEQVAQGEAAARAAAARVAAQEVTLDKLSLVAPRAGRIDSLPYEVGDQAPIGAPLAILLVGDAPYARVYVPEPIRTDVRIGSDARVFVDGRERPLAGKVRMIRGEPSFTPYYALTGEDAARLSYLAEIELTGEEAVGLPAGLPVRVEFSAGQAGQGDGRK
ncbi:HlyD family secretion protein [Lysobacter sp. A286]